MSTWLAFFVVAASVVAVAGVSAARFRGRRAHTGHLSSREGGRVSVRGTLQCPEPLRSPVTGQLVLAYCVEVQATFLDGARLRRDTVHRSRRVAPFTIDDGSGTVHVAAGPDDRLFPQKVAFDETRKVTLAKSVMERPEHFGEASYPVDPNIVPGGADFLRVVERTVAVPEEATVIGEVQAGTLSRSRSFELWVDGGGRTPIHLLTEHALPAVGQAVLRAWKSVRRRASRQVTGG